MRPLTILAVLLLAPAMARANGAFPDELQIFAPLDQPQRIVVGTTYGLLISNDDGASWSWVCESAVATPQVLSYAASAAGQLWAVADTRVLTSGDDGCTWRTEDLASIGVASVADLFADPTTTDRAFATTYQSGGTGFAIFGSGDGGFAGPLFASGSALLGGIEVARSSPSVVFAVRYTYGSPGVVSVLRSDDRGATWTEVSHPELGDAYPGIAAVHPMDAATLYVRLRAKNGTDPDRIAVSHDSGQTFTVVLTAPGTLTALAVAEDGTVYVADREHHLWIGDASGAFTQIAGPSVRCLAARAGALFACGDAVADGFILARSTDRGATFSPLVTSSRYQTASCGSVRAVCPVVNPILDAGQPGAGGDAGSSPTPPAKQGCGCTSAFDPLSLIALALALMARGAGALGRDRRRG